jgi:hypothetical protein
MRQIEGRIAHCMKGVDHMAQPVALDKRIHFEVARSLYEAIQADATALGVTVKELSSVLLVEALNANRARRYAPYRLPDSYGWDVFGKGYTAEPEEQEGAITPMRKSRGTR